jgi:hypothetical protein
MKFTQIAWPDLRSKCVKRKIQRFGSDPIRTHDVLGHSESEQAANRGRPYWKPIDLAMPRKAVSTTLV